MGFASHFCVFYFNTHFGEWKLLFLVHGGKVWAFFFWKIALGKIVSSRWLVWALLGFLPLPRYSGGFRFLVLPPAGYFPVMESNQRSPGLRARTPRRGEIRSIPFPADAENCIALLCPSFSPPDPLRWAPAGPPRGGRRWGLRGLQILWLLPAVLASALNTSAIGPSGGYPPCKTCE